MKANSLAQRRVALQQQLDRLQPVADALGVVEPVHPEEDPAPLELLAQLAELLLGLVGDASSVNSSVSIEIGWATTRT
jgi:hypothetical protein